MIGSYEVVTLCGSTRFKDDFINAQKQLTLNGKIVVSLGLFGHSDDEDQITPEVEKMLDDMHKKRIDMADSIFVINRNNYIGDSTKSEIEYAKKTGKRIKYMFEYQKGEAK